MFFKAFVRLVVFLSVFKVYSDSLTLVDHLPFAKGAASDVSWNQSFRNDHLIVSGFSDMNQQIVKIYDLVKNNLVEQNSMLLSPDLIVNSSKWLNTRRSLYASFSGLDIEIYKYGKSSKTLSPTKAIVDFGGTVNSTDWLSFEGNYYLASGGKSDVNQEIKIYRFNEENDGKLEEIAAESFYKGNVRSVSWSKQVNGKFYLAVGGAESNSISQEIRVYEFDPKKNTLKFKSSVGLYCGNAESVQWLHHKKQNFLAVSGYKGQAGEFLGIYNFEATSNSLTLVHEELISGGYTMAMSGMVLDESIYLALAFETKNFKKMIKVYKVDLNHPRLEEVAEHESGYGFVRSVSWHVNSENQSDAYLVSGGDDKHDNGLELYKFSISKPNNSFFEDVANFFADALDNIF